MTHSIIKKESGQQISSALGSMKLTVRALTSLQSPLGDFVAESSQTRPVVGSHLDLVVGPDDEVLQQQVGHIWAGDVLDLVVDRQPGQTIPEENT